MIQNAPADVPKAKPGDFLGRWREVVSDPLNLLIRRVPTAGMVADGLVTLHNGHRVPLRGIGSYYEDYGDLLIVNRGVHEPLEEYAFQETLPHIPADGTILELGSYWAHYAMWFLMGQPGRRAVLVEPEDTFRRGGEENFARHGLTGTFRPGFIGTGRDSVDAIMADAGLDRVTVLHADIQGHEDEMILGAPETFGKMRADFVFLSTHGQKKHLACRDMLAAAGYRIEADSDHMHHTTSCDGFILAVNPGQPRILPDIRLMGRRTILRADPVRTVAYLRQMQRGPG